MSHKIRENLEISMNSDETTVCMYDINTGKSSEIYRTTNKNIKILAAIGDNILISARAWMRGVNPSWKPWT